MQACIAMYCLQINEQRAFQGFGTLLGIDMIWLTANAGTAVVAFFGQLAIQIFTAQVPSTQQYRHGQPESKEWRFAARTPK